MKKVLILDGSRHHSLSQSHLDFLRFLKDNLRSEKYEVHTADIQHTALVVRGGKPGVYLNTGEDISQFDFVLFRNASRFGALAAPVGMYLASQNIAYANGMDGSGGYVGKIGQMFLFALNGLPVPDSLVLRNPRALAEFLPDFSSGERLVVKDNNGLRGRRNFLVEAGFDAEVFMDSHPETYIIQKYIPNEADYRVLFMGYDSPPLIFKRTGAAGSHLNNTSQGGSAQKVDDFPAGALESARAAAKLFGREVAGVDILFGPSGEHYVLEVNETPAIASGFNPEAKMKLLDDYLREKTAEG